MAKVIDLVKDKGFDTSIGIVEEIQKVNPELAFFDARTIAGTQFKTLVMISDPVTGFREINNGIDASDEGYDLRTFDLAIVAGLCQRDKAVFDADPTGKDAALKRAALATLRSGMKTLSGAVWYGDSTSKFSGVAGLVKASLVIDAGGSTANGTSSVYAVGNDVMDGCGLVFNENSGLISTAELVWQLGKMLGQNNKEVPCYWTDLTSWAGFSCVNANRMGRIANLEKTAGKSLTDEHLADLETAYKKANDGMLPSAYFVSYDQLRALQKSRGAKVYVGPRDSKEVTAAVPTEYNGVPIIGTPNIKDTEAVWTEPEEESSSSSSSSGS